MNLLWKLIPPPYGVIVHYGLMLLAIAAFAGFFYVKGVDHQQLVDQAAAERAGEQARALTLKREEAMRAISTTYQGVHANDQAIQPAAQDAVVHFIDGPGGLRGCPAQRGAQMPGVRSQPAAEDAGAGTDPGGHQALAADIGHDAVLYASCKHQLDALIDTAIAAGADQP